MAALSHITTAGQNRPAVNHRAFILSSLLALLAVLGWWLLFPTPAAAHANLASSDPPANSELETAPGRIIIWFTEPIEPGLSEIRVLDASGKQMDLGDSVVDDLNPLAMSVGLGDVPDGTYTVAWKNVSTVDGHRVRGSFVFAVGQPLSGAPVEQIDQPLLQSPVAPVLRWLTLLGALAMSGGLVFELLVTRPVLFGLRSTSCDDGCGPKAGVSLPWPDMAGPRRFPGRIGGAVAGTYCHYPRSLVVGRVARTPVEHHNRNGMG